MASTAAAATPRTGVRTRRRGSSGAIGCGPRCGPVPRHRTTARLGCTSGSVTGQVWCRGRRRAPAEARLPAGHAGQSDPRRCAARLARPSGAIDPSGSVTSGRSRSGGSRRLGPAIGRVAAPRRLAARQWVCGGIRCGSVRRRAGARPAHPCRPRRGRARGTGRDHGEVLVAAAGGVVRPGTGDHRESADSSRRSRSRSPRPGCSRATSAREVHAEACCSRCAVPRPRSASPRTDREQLDVRTQALGRLVDVGGDQGRARTGRRCREPPRHHPAASMSSGTSRTPSAVVLGPRRRARCVRSAAGPGPAPRRASPARLAGHGCRHSA